MYFENLSDEEFIARMRTGGLTPSEDALLFRLERAVDKKTTPDSVGQRGPQYSLPWEMGWLGVEEKK